MKKKHYRPLVMGLLLIFNWNELLSQHLLYTAQQDKLNRFIRTAAVFLNMPPDARATAMGQAAVATSPDVNSIHWNAAKLALIDSEEKSGFSISYTPWMRDLTNETSLSYLSGYYKLKDKQTLGVALKYFNFGTFEVSNNQGFLVQQLKPREFSVAVSYARKLSDAIGLAITGKFIHSSLPPDLHLHSQYILQTTNTGAFDIGFYYNKDVYISSRFWSFSFGTNISNIGPRISYTNSAIQEFMPTNFRVGTSITTDIGLFNKISFAFDLNKLMVPTPPIKDEAGNVIRGIDPNRHSVASGMFNSFVDAPGGFSEELQELMMSLGIEYWYNDFLAARIGFFQENIAKGNKSYVAVGVGTRYQFVVFDVAYLLSQIQNNPYGDTVKISLAFNFQGQNNNSLPIHHTQDIPAGE